MCHGCYEAKQRSHLLFLRGQDEAAPSPPSSLPHTCLASSHPVHRSPCSTPAPRPERSHSRVWGRDWSDKLKGVVYVYLYWSKLNMSGWLTRRRAACRPPGCSCSGSGRGRSPRWSRYTARVCRWPGCPRCRWGCGSRWRECRTRAQLKAGWRHLERRRVII